MTCEPTPLERAMADGHQEQIIEAGWDTPPRWLRWCGLPQVLGASAMDVLELAIRAVLARRNLTRPLQDEDGQIAPPNSISYTNEQFMRQIGASDSTVRRALGVLQHHNLIEVIRRGHYVATGPRRPSWAIVDMKLVERCYVLAASAIPKHAGGLQGRGSINQVRVQVWQGDEPCSINRGLASDLEWSEPPVPLIEALCLRPQHWEAIFGELRALIQIERECTALMHGRWPVALEDLASRCRSARWMSPETRALVENSVEKRIRGEQRASQNDWSDADGPVKMTGPRESGQSK